MCGICGTIGFSSKETGEAVTRRMLAAIVHRGPDEEGILVAAPIAVGARRLSIIDLPGGSQPVWNETGTLAVVFNGEIYNFRELREELEGRAHRFRSQSDTEVIVHAYEEWGDDSVKRLRGMFAFAVVELPQGRNSRATRVFLARDRLGIKPLYYTRTDGVFLFASEVRALLASGLVSMRLSPDAVTGYLLFGSAGEPTTLVQGVFSLPPGHRLSVSSDDPGCAPEPKAYWEAPQPFETMAETKPVVRTSGGRAASPASQVRSLLEDSVRRHLIADVPIGVFLSSGIDSTAIAALATSVQGGIQTFTVAFPDTAFSEAKIARRTADLLGTQHCETVISGDEMASRLGEAISALDQPSMDGINTYFVCWAARQAGLKVALSGLGSDEIFGGYSSFRATTQIRRLALAAAVVPQALRKFIGSGIRRTNFFESSPDAFRKALAAWLQPNLFPHPYFFTRALFAPQAFPSRMRESTVQWDSMPWFRWLAGAVKRSRSMDRFTQVSWLELRSYMVNTLLRDTDAMSMRNSLEVRVPFLDTPLVEYVLALPESAKRGSGRPKALLIEALGSLLPGEVLKQPKRTFTFPWEYWMRGKLGERVAVGLGDWAPALGEVLDVKFGQSVWRNFLLGRRTWSRPWSLYVLNEWIKRNSTVPIATNQEQRASSAVHVN
jgi:asparagine synthase (glutamine-hydrolysing)